MQQIRGQRPERIPGEHRHAAGREVDDPRASVGQNDAERDAGDQRARAEPEQREQQDLLHVSGPSLTRDVAEGPHIGRRLRFAHDGGWSHPAVLTNTCFPL